jgi:dihydroxy-acid dehydratase
MGTASTMACITAALGLMPLEGASAPAVSSARLRVAEQTGAIAVKVASSDKSKPQSLLTRDSFINAITVLQAIGGSTNAIVHLMAIINRHPKIAGSITLQTIDEVGKRTPLLVDLKPSGDNYMTDFHNAGGMSALLHRLRPLLRLDATTLTGETLGERLDAHPFKNFPYSTELIRPLEDPIYESSALVVLTGNLAPGGAILKAAASKDRRLLEFSGTAVVFENTADLARRIDSDGLAVSKDSVLVLKNAGPIGNPGMPEAGVIPIPRKLRGVKDMLRLSDGRMSGTAGGTIILHISPETGLVDSPFAILRDGDEIECSVSRRRLHVRLSDEAIKERVELRKARLAEEEQCVDGGRVLGAKRRGYRGLYEGTVNQAEHGADFGFLTADGSLS